MSDPEIEKLRAAMEKYAKRKGYSLNPDRELVDTILRGLLENRRKYGYQYCPCRVLTGRKEEDLPKICPCKWHEEEIRTMGHCHCGLFVGRNQQENPPSQEVGEK